MSQIAVIGGGFAGLAAAVQLSHQGHRVTLLERRHQLGGRAYSFTDPNTSDTLDNGQHLFMKCYRDTLQFLRLIGAEDGVHFQSQFHIDYQESANRAFTLSIPKWIPSPLNLLIGFLCFKAIRWTDVIALRRLNLKAELSLTLSVDHWLTQSQQPNRLRRAFWHPLCVAALNEPPERASACQLQAVLREAFFGPSNGSLIGYSKTGLSDLYTQQAQTFIENHHGTIQFGASVKEIEIHPNQNLTLHLRSGESLNPAVCICAVPPPALFKMLSNPIFSELQSTLQKFQPSPILSVNLWFDRPITNKPFHCLLNTQMEWLFNKQALYASAKQTTEGHVTLIASAARHLAKKSETEIIALALAELHALFPIAKQAHLQHARVICEHRATYSLPLGYLAPNTTTAHPALFLAGDWTNTGLPATIESAVRSGFAAAETTHQYLK